MGNTSGFARDLLITAPMIWDGANPGTKITSPGFLEMLIEKASGAMVSNAKQTPSGHYRDIVLRTRARGVPDEATDTLSCDASNAPLYQETTITQSLFKQISLNFDLATIPKFEEEASKYISTNTGNAPAQFPGWMKFVWDAIYSKMNAMVGAMDQDLLAKQLLNFGVNQTTGVNTATTINLTLATTTNPLNEGITGLMGQAVANEFDWQNSAFVGSGLMYNYWVQNVLKSAKGVDAAGLNTQSLGLPPFYNDQYAASTWGANKFAVIDPRAVNFIDLNVYKGFRAVHLDDSWYFSMPFQITTSSGKTFTLDFDVQVQEHSCAETIVDGYGQNLTVGPGITVFIRKAFDIFNIPVAAYSITDRLYRNNGTLLYTATNA